MNDRQTAMLTSYFELARRSREDAEFKRRLSDSPREVLTESGWELPEGTDVEVRFGDPEGAGPVTAEQIVTAWESAIDAGRLRVLIPSQPPPGLETSELSDQELAGASGGARNWSGVCTCCAGSE